MELGSFVMPMSRSRRRGGCLSEKKYNKSLPNSSSSASEAVVQQEDNDKGRNKNTRFQKTGGSGDIRKKRKRSSGGVLSTSWATKRHRVAAKLNSSTQKGGNDQTLGHENSSHFPPENNGSGKVHGSGRQKGNGKGQLPSDDKVHEYSRKRRRHELEATLINSTLHCQNNENALPNGQEQDGPRVLRPRLTTAPTKWQRTKQKLYKEVDLCEADGPRILAHRIKVWWPLDAAWYYGEVKEYDRKKRLHRVVYDDQEEEWLYLENERFMLQVDEGEVFGRLGEIVSEFVGKRKHHRRRLKKKQHRSKHRGSEDAVGHVSEENVIRPVEHCTLSTKQIGDACSPPTLDALLENTRKGENKDDCRNLKAIIPIRNPRVWSSRKAGYIECLPLYRPFANMILTMGYHLLKWSIGSRLPLSMQSIRSVVSRDFLNHICSRLSLVKNWPGSRYRNSITVSIPNMLCADLFSEVFGFQQVPSKRPVRDKSALTEDGSQQVPSRRKRDSHTIKIALIEDCCFLDFPLQPANNSRQLSRSYDPENKVVADPLVNAEAADPKRTLERRICLVSNSRQSTSGPILNVLSDKLKSENNISSKRVSPICGQPSMALVDLGTNRKLRISEDPDNEKLQKMDLSNIYKRSKFTAEHLTIDCNPQEPSTVTPQIGLRRCTSYKGDVSDDDSMGAETPVPSKKAALDVELEHDASVRNWRSVGFAADSIEGEMAYQCWWDSSSYMLHDVDLEIRKCRRVENVGIPEDLEVSPSDNRASPSANHPSQAKSQFKVNRLSGSNQQKLIDVDSASCTANVLVMKDDRGWRETGATIHLKLVDGGWMLLIDIHGETAYGHKAEQFAAVGATNRYTHAMMWKGGKGWILEFEDRKHWSVFKMMHEECFQRNARAACIRHIPVPCFQPVEDYFTRMPPSTFARPVYRYIRYSEADSDMGSSSRILYDMDSEDEEWLTQSCSGDENMLPNVLELTFEQIVDRLEKAAHVQQNDVLSADAAMELCEGLASLEVVGRVYAHWSKKRRIKGMSLIRYFQAAPWERYQEQLERWNEELQQKSPNEIKQQPISQSKKPPPYAFCLRPRGLEMPNKLQKQRSQRKQLYSRQYGELFSESPRQQLATDSKTEWPTGLTSGIQQINEDEPATGPGDSLLEGSTIKDMANDRWIFQHRSTASIDHILKARKGRKMRRRTVYAEDSERRRIRSNVCFRLQQQQRQSHVYRGHRPWHAAYSKLVSPSAVSNDGMSNQPCSLSEIAAAAVKNAVMARARAESAYALADVAMHRAMSAVIAAEAIQAAEAAALSAYNARERQRGETCSADEIDAGVCVIDENDAGPIQIRVKRLSEGDACVQPAQTSSQTGNMGLTAVGLDSGALDTAVEVQSGALDIDEGELLGTQDKLQRIASLLRNPLSPSQRLEQLHQGSMVEAMPT